MGQRHRLDLRVLLEMPPRADGAADEDVDALHHALLAAGVLHLAAHEADVRHLHGRARVRAPRPDHPQVAFGEIKHAFQVLRGGVRLLFGFDLREPAELLPRARHHPRQHRAHRTSFLRQLRRARRPR